MEPNSIPIGHGANLSSVCRAPSFEHPNSRHRISLATVSTIQVSDPTIKQLKSLDNCSARNRSEAHLFVIAVVFNSLQTGTSQSEESGNNAKWQNGFNWNRLDRKKGKVLD